LTNGTPEAKKPLYNKGNGYQIEEEAHRMGKNLFSCTSDKGLKNRIYRKLKILNSQKLNDPMKK
jgi:hypothetical protein